jgi:hypothetical protein
MSANANAIAKPKVRPRFGGACREGRSVRLSAPSRRPPPSPDGGGVDRAAPKQPLIPHRFWGSAPGARHDPRLAARNSSKYLDRSLGAYRHT